MAKDFIWDDSKLSQAHARRDLHHRNCCGQIAHARQIVIPSAARNLQLVGVAKMQIPRAKSGRSE